MQRDRLTDEFSTALKNFQTIQRTAAEKERASVARARAQSGNYTKVLSWLTSLISPGKLLWDIKHAEFITCLYITPQTPRVLHKGIKPDEI